MSGHAKIVFELSVDEDGFPPIGSEALNATTEGPGFVLENTPFFATGVALGDRVEAKAIEGTANKFSFVRVIESSRNRAISVIFLDIGTKEDVYQYLRARGCYCEYGEFGESGRLQMLAVAIPDTCNYQSVVTYLANLEADDRLSYAELAV